MTETRLKTAQVELRLLPEIKAAAEQAAADDHLSVTSLIEKLLADHLTEKGYLPSDQEGTRPEDLNASNDD